jgi:hypothetical protein
MEPTQELLDAIYRDKVEAARHQKPGEKLLEGARLFDEVCEQMEAGIRRQFPGADDDEVRRILRDRINRLRRVEEHGIYRPVEDAV